MSLMASRVNCRPINLNGAEQRRKLAGVDARLILLARGVLTNTALKEPSTIGKALTEDDK